MDRRSVVIGSIGGIAVTALVLLAFPTIYRSAEQHRAFFDLASLRVDLLWFALLGAALGVAIIASKRYPLIPAVSAVLLGYGYFMTFRGSGPLVDWIPFPVIIRFLRSATLTAFVLVGVLAATAAWHLWQANRMPRPRRAITVRHQALGAVAGVAVVIALLPVLERLWFALIRHGSFGEMPAARRAMLGMVLVGVVFAALIILSERLPFLAVSAGAVLTLFVVMHPLFGIMPFDGITDFMFKLRLFLPPDLAVIAGLLTAVAVWRVIELRRVTEPYRVFSVGGERGEGLGPITR